MVAGVHFLPEDPPGDIAKKLLRVNLSDLAAMGAAPLGYLLALVRSNETSEAWLADFCQRPRRRPGGVRDRAVGRRHGRDARAAHAVADRDRPGAEGPGAAAQRRPARRRRSGSPGTLGDAALGLKVLQGELDATAAARAYLDRTLPPAAAAPRARPGAARRRPCRDRRLGRPARRPRPHPRDLGRGRRAPGRGAAARRRRARSARRPRGGAIRRRRLRAAVHRTAASAAPRSPPSPASSPSRSPASARSTPSQAFTSWMKPGVRSEFRKPVGSTSDARVCSRSAYSNSSSSALASFRSAVSKPSVNQP